MYYCVVFYVRNILYHHGLRHIFISSVPSIQLSNCCIHKKNLVLKHYFLGNSGVSNHPPRLWKGARMVVYRPKKAINPNIASLKNVNICLRAEHLICFPLDQACLHLVQQSVVEGGGLTKCKHPPKSWAFNMLSPGSSLLTFSATKCGGRGRPH